MSTLDGLHCSSVLRMKVQNTMTVKRVCPHSLFSAACFKKPLDPVDQTKKIMGYADRQEDALDF